MSEIPSLATDKDIVNMVTALIGGLCLVIGGAIGFFTKYFYESKKIKENKKALRQQMITNNIAPMRQEWINTLRTSSSEYFTDINLIVIYQNSKDEKFRDEFRSQYTSAVLNYQFKYSNLDLMLPFKREGNDENEAEKVRKKLEELDNYFRVDKDKRPSPKIIKSKIKECRELLKTLLKKEWDETKSLKEID
ncbi:hypothetical protein KDV25_18170 [Morganella morganii]|uniref:hypothetical protein n=1 Tax=Morganella morganii TaxID=582 RepID=UPI001BDB0D3D|nr:hypothetical protein [Morganella morganii]MBT0355925.1 hypothetical protein [Morganella morganii subsp. morganii]HCD1132967.1 hypothetical protein [Morganella morganii]